MERKNKSEKFREKWILSKLGLREVLGVRILVDFQTMEGSRGDPGGWPYECGLTVNQRR